MIFLRQSTASQEVPLGRFVDSTDGNTEETALTIANTDIKIWKTGATTLANKNSGGATHIANGEYYCVLDATDTDTIGPLKITIHVAGALYVQVFCCVLDEAMYDWFFGTVAPLAPTVAGRTLDVSAGGEAGVDWANVGSPTTALDLSGTTIKTTQKVDVDTIKTNPVVNGGTITFPSNKTLADATALATVQADTDDIQTRLPAALTADGNIKADLQRVHGTDQTARDLGARLDDFVSNATVPLSTMIVAIRSNTAQAGGASTITLDAAASATDDFYIGLMVYVYSGTGAGQPRLITDYDGTTKVATVDRAWKNVPANGDGFRLYPAVGLDLIQTIDAAIKAKTDNLPASPAAVGSAMTLTAAYDAAKTAAQAGDAMALVNNAITAAKVATDAIDADALAADAVAEIAAGILGATITELGAVPSASPTMTQAVALLYMALRNRLDVTNANKSFYNDAGAALAAKALSDDGVTYSEAKMA